MSRLAFPAMPEDHPALERVLVRAFMEDPVMRWFDPSPPQRERRLLRLFDHVLKKYLPRGTVATDPQHRAAAVWVPPAEPVTAADIRFYLGLYADRLPKGLFWALFVETRRPRRPHYLLLYMGVDPEHQGRGLGGMLLDAGLARADADGHPAYLVASSPGSRRLYERHGFRVQREVRLMRGPPVWPMLREPS